MTLESDAKFKEKPICFKKWQEFGEFWSEHSKVSKICTLTCPFWAKFITFDLRKSKEELHFHDTEEWCKVWRKTDLWFGKWHEEFGKFSPEHSKILKLGLWWGPFIQSRKCMSLKSPGVPYVLTLKNDAKFEEECSKLTWGICRSLTRKLENFEKLNFNGI